MSFVLIYWIKGNSKKGGLSDLYKVTKDVWEDPVIRTCGESKKVKNIDTEKQIKEPLSQKFKEWIGMVYWLYMKYCFYVSSIID